MVGEVQVSLQGGVGADTQEATAETALEHRPD